MDASGFALHLSSKSVSGYKGVSKERGRFVARKRDGEHMRHLGSYDTLIEAAVAFAGDGAGSQSVVA